VINWFARHASRISAWDMQIQTDVLQVLSTVSIDGNLARITAGDLDLRLYQRVDKVLQALGGKWDRRQRAHVFPDSPSQRFELALATAEVTTDQELSWFPTPDKVADQVVKLAQIEDRHEVLEPSAGRGALLEAIARSGKKPNVALIEFDDCRRGYLLGLVGPSCRITVKNGDFLAVKFMHDFDRVVMNPPFCKVGRGDHLDHVRRAFELLVFGRDARLVAVLPRSITFRQDRRHIEFRTWYEQLGGEVSTLPEGAFKESGTGVHAVILVLVKR
jgi:predicted RNA methylase